MITWERWETQRDEGQPACRYVPDDGNCARCGGADAVTYAWLEPQLRGVVCIDCAEALKVEVANLRFWRRLASAVWRSEVVTGKEDDHVEALV